MVKQIYNKNSIEKTLQKRFLKNFMDLLILVEISRTPLISGYDIIVAFQRKFNLFISPGTVYSTLYRLERDGLIRGEERKRKRVYILTSKGEEFVRRISILQENFNFILSKILVKAR
ncbi:MAG: PadR family transcriptional regulator [Candidatus Bathyarchaeia archaeon]